VTLALARLTQLPLLATLDSPHEKNRTLAARSSHPQDATNESSPEQKRSKSRSKAPKAAAGGTPQERTGRKAGAARREESSTARSQSEQAEQEDPSNDATDDEPGDEAETDGEDLEQEDLLGDGQVIEVAGELVEDESLLDTTTLEPAKIVSTDRGLAKVDALQLYMSEVQRHALLSADEEKRLAEEYTRTGNVDIAARLVTANLRLVVKLAYEYRRACRNIMDLIQEGNIGLMQAVRRYDPYRGVKLSSYAAWWIRAYMLRYILNNWRLVKLGTTQAQRKLFFNLNKEKAKLTALGIEPSHAEIAKRLDVDEKDVIEMDRRLASSDASLDTPIGDSDGRQTSRMDLLPATAAGPDQLTENSQLQELLRGHLDDFKTTLAGKDLQIFEQRLVADEPMTLQELGEQFGVSRERVRQLEARLAGKLRTFLSERLGDAVLIRQ
jgi:RNA polymerase sigma-32 factor